MSAPAWVPQAPHAERARDLMPPESRALLRRLDRLAERLMATYPAHAEAVRAWKLREPNLFARFSLWLARHGKQLVEV